MKFRFAAGWITLLALVAGLIAGFAWRRVRQPETPAVATHRREPAPNPGAPETKIESAAAMLDRIDRASLDRWLEVLSEALLRGPLPAEEWEALRKALGENPRQGIEAIVRYLQSGRDAPTARNFVLGEGGRLEEGPTLRVVLLDWLGVLARETGASEGAELGRAVLTQKRSAEEWALALRNVAWHEPNASDFLAAKMREMLAHPPWRREPSAGLLEAFDVIVYLRDPSFVPSLASMVGADSGRLQRAAAVALDRLAETAPMEVMTLLNKNPALLADRPFLRADYFAKANFDDPAQRQAVEGYLGRLDVSVAEKTKFVESVAVPGAFVSDNLLTAPPPLHNPQRDAAVTRVTGEWLRSGRFPQLHAPLQEFQSRLGAFR